MWRLRETIPEAQRHAGPSLKHDVSVPITELARFVTQAGGWLADNVPDGELICYGHLGDGSLHFNVQMRAAADPAAFQARTAAVRREIHDRVAQLGGSFSAEAWHWPDQGAGAGTLQIGRRAGADARTETPARPAWHSQPWRSAVPARRGWCRTRKSFMI
ncbi:MAG: FAD-binding oxidoreductase, partial [Gammaproteobacteria bacterium]|nr:FAD-binding oxidoreductase [Gammaproteobacteria bacterium]